MALIGNPVQVQIPHEPGEYMLLRKPPFVITEQAKKIREKEERQSARDFGGEIMKVLMEGDDGDEAASRVRKLVQDREYSIEAYDLKTLLLYCIDDWSYDAPVDEEHIEQLETATAKWAGQAIIDMTRPPSAEEEKNFSGGSTTPSTATEARPLS